MTTPQILWQPGQSLIEQSHLTKFMKWLEENKGLSFPDYDALWVWSASDTQAFWKCIYEFFQVIDHGHPKFVHTDDPMPHTKWFGGSKVNYAEHIFRDRNDADQAILFRREDGLAQELTWGELKSQVARMADFLRNKGIEKGDRVVAYVPNIPAATVAFLATCSIGAVWSSCSPDFGASSVVDRFRQIQPKVFLTVDGYMYGGKSFDKKETVSEIIDQLSTVEVIIELPYLSKDPWITGAISFEDILKNRQAELTFTPVDFSDPIWVLYSSGTTGQPKAITHSQGGVLLEHLKYVAFHNDVKAGERYFWFTTTGWMMWNFVQATMLMGATIVLFDGNPAYPDLHSLWKLTQDFEINHFGTSAPFIMACLKKELKPKEKWNLESLRSISSTGSPLPPEGFSYIYEQVKPEVWLCSMSGGTDVCSAFVGGCPTVPLYEGEIQRRALGCAMSAFDEAGQELVGEVGEMVITKPMPSMPIYFWNDAEKDRYKESYFDMYPNVWRHGDWLLITERNTLIIKGRSDATLNRHGIRIGTAEIYQSVNRIEAIKDSLVVNLEMDGGQHFMPLFVVLKEGYDLDGQLKDEIKKALKRDFTSRHVPDEVFKVDDIPYTISGKKMEAPVKKILMNIPKEKAANLGAMKNPESLDQYLPFMELINQKF